MRQLDMIGREFLLMLFVVVGSFAELDRSISITDTSTELQNVLLQVHGYKGNTGNRYKRPSY